MVWIFAAIVLILMVISEGFRKVALCFMGLAGIVGAILVIVILFRDNSMSTAATPAKTSCDISAEKSSDARTAFFACGADNKE